MLFIFTNNNNDVDVNEYDEEEDVFISMRAYMYLLKNFICQKQKHVQQNIYEWSVNNVL